MFPVVMSAVNDAFAAFIDLIWRQADGIVYTDIPTKFPWNARTLQSRKEIFFGCYFIVLLASALGCDYMCFDASCC